MFKRSITAIFFSLLCASLLVTPAFASGPQDNCTSLGGSWSGPNSVTGVCTYQPGNARFNANCDDTNTSYVEIYSTSVLINSYCTSAETIDDRPESTENDDGSITLHLGGGKNGSATFPAGSCPQQCTISATLPNAAGNALPGDALATLYVRVVDENGEPGTGTYTVCFENPSGEALTIYRFVSGVWTAVQVAASNPICVTASGDGAFYLGG